MMVPNFPSAAVEAFRAMWPALLSQKNQVLPITVPHRGWLFRMQNVKTLIVALALTLAHSPF